MQTIKHSFFNYPKTTSKETKIDLTPMLDVVFILLIFFVVTANFINVSSLQITGQTPLPEQTDTENQDLNILIEIQNDAQIIFNGEHINTNTVRARISQVQAENPQASVIIKPHADSVANELVYVLNEARINSVNDIKVLE